MAYARTALAPHGFVATPSKPSKPRPWRSLWQWLRDAIEESHQHAMDREIEAYLRARGGRLTDRAEREIEQMLYSYSPTRW